jgi:small membrane protein
MMQAEITPAAVALVALLAALFLHDFVTLARNRKLLLVQLVVFAIGGSLIVYPEIARRLAHAVGIGRGVDFVLYPLVIWLVRESLLSRRRRHEEQERVTELVRTIAASGAHEISAANALSHSSSRAPAHSAGSSASCTE